MGYDAHEYTPNYIWPQEEISVVKWTKNGDYNAERDHLKTRRDFQRFVCSRSIYLYTL